MSRAADRRIHLAEQHLGRVAYRTRDNPYLRLAAVTKLDASSRRVLTAVLDGDLTARQLACLDKVLARGHVGLGVLPRELQLLVRDGAQVGVESLLAFAEVSRFWWLVSYLWCFEVGRAVDRRIADSVLAYRFHPRFLRSPATSGRMFRKPPRITKKFADIAHQVSEAHDGSVVATATVDLRGYYYSVTAPPSEIVRSFIRSTESKVHLSTRGRALTVLLDSAHKRYAEEDRRLQPRGANAGSMSWPLPVGLPSSQVLANLIMAVVLDDLATLPSIAGVAAYADDALILSPTLPDVGELAPTYLDRLGVLLDGDGEERVLNSPRGSRLASLVVAEEKCGISYSRAPRARRETALAGSDEDDEGFTHVTALDPYLDPVVDADWGGRLRTVLRAPFKRDRVPRERIAEIRALVDEIRVGADQEYVESVLVQLLNDLDSAAILELRSYWPELIACAYFAGGAEAVDALLTRASSAIESLEPPAHANEALREAMESGLQFSIAQALAEGLAVARGTQRVSPSLDKDVLNRATGGSRAAINQRVRRIRANKFVSAEMISAPLSEFTSWDGPLFGAAAYEGFESWATTEDADEVTDVLEELIGQAKRFIPLHDICIAVHLWVRPDHRGWRALAFRVFRAQPLVDGEGVTDLHARARRALRLDSGARVDNLLSYRVQVGAPSIGISEDQLKARIRNDRSAISRVARAARIGVRNLLDDATAKRVDVMVFPEWSLPATLLPHVSDVAARRRMLIVGGEAPRVSGGNYLNRVWTVIPITDGGGRRHCLVPPPREKRHLSHVEQRDIADAGIVHSPGTGPIPVYEWRGIGFASLICFEFADIRIREELRPDADLLTVSSWNTDWRYFDAIQDATTRDNYCVTMCVNTSQFPGTRLTRPVVSEKSVALSVHGSQWPAVVVKRIDLLPVIVARASNRRPSANSGFLPPGDDLALVDYKALPPTFGI